MSTPADENAPAKLPPAPELPKGAADEQQGHRPFPSVGVGASAGGLKALVDVDQWRRAQEELQKKTAELRQQDLLLDLSQDAIIVRDAENHVVSWNRGAQDMYGWSADEARGKLLDQLLHTDPAVWARLNAQLDKVGNWEGDLRQQRRDGMPIVVH